MNPQIVLTQAQKKKIRDRIQEIESAAHTRIVIRFIRNHEGSVVEAATQAFSDHRLYHEKVKTGILLFISLKQKQFQILGDAHIHEKIGEDGWNRLAARLSERFKAGHFDDGIRDFLDEVSKTLEHHFPKHE